MGLAERLAVTAAKPISGCRTCRFYQALEHDDRRAFDNWVSSGEPLTRLRAACEEDGLEVSDRAFRDHIKNHHKVVGDE